MADLTKLYPQKLGRFLPNTCMTLYYSTPVITSTFSSIEDSGIFDISYKFIKITTDEDYGWAYTGYIFSSGIISGEIHTSVGNVTVIKVNKDSFVNLDDYNNFLSKHNGITYGFEVLGFYNTADVAHSFLSDVRINTKKRINNYSSYSPYAFNYNKDFYYEIETKVISISDLSQVDDILRAPSFVLKSSDESVIRTGALDNLPDIIGDDIAQPYFGGVQNNEWYRATLIDDEFTWSKGKYKGKLKFKVTG